MSKLELGLIVFFAPILFCFMMIVIYALIGMIRDREWQNLVVMGVAIVWIGTVIWLVIP